MCRRCRITTPTSASSRRTLPRRRSATRSSPTSAWPMRPRSRRRRPCGSTPRSRPRRARIEMKWPFDSDSVRTERSGVAAESKWRTESTLRANGWAMLLFALFAWAGVCHAEVAIPPLHARVTDLTNTLEAQQTQQLESELAALEQRKGAQVVVLMLPSTQPETIEQYATRVFDQWKIGRKHVDDGVLLVVAKDDHRVFIETGYGLEGAIPDALASRIIREYITPKFRAGDFYGGLRDGLGALAKLIDGEPLPPPPREGSGNGGTGNFGGFLAIGFFLAFFFRGVF